MTLTVLDISEEVALIQYMLSLHLGPAGKWCDPEPFLMEAIRSVVEMDSHHTLLELFAESYEEMDDVACENMALELRNQLISKLRRIYTLFDEEMTYVYRITTLGDLYIEEKPKTREHQRRLHEEALLEELRESYERGDYLSQTQRRLIGV